MMLNIAASNMGVLYGLERVAAFKGYNLLHTDQII
jgi:hypothetical protein